MSVSTADLQTSEPTARFLFKDILRGSGLYGVAFFAPTLAGVILLPVMTRSLTSTDYGVTDLLAQVGTVLNLLLGAYFSSALGFFYFAAEPGEARRKVVDTAILGSALIGVAAVLISLPFAGVIERLVFPHVTAKAYIALVIVSLLPGFVLEALFAWLRVENRQGMFVAVSLMRTLVTMAGIILLVGVFGLRVWGVLWTGVAAVLASITFLIVHWGRAKKNTFDTRLFIAMAKYALPLGLSAIAMFVVNFGDRFILPHYRPFDDLGIYALGCKIGMLMTSVYSAFSVYWGAQVFDILRRPDAETVFPRILTYVVLATSFCAVGLSVCAQPAVRILATPAYHRAAALVPIIVAAYFLRAIGDFIRSVLLVAGRPADFAICNWIGAVICIGGYALLVPRYGIWGAATATVAAFAVIFLLSAVWSYRAMPYRVEWNRVAKIATAAALALVVNRLAGVTSLPGQIVCAAVSIGIFPLVLFVLRFPTAGEVRVGREAMGTLFRTALAGVVRLCG